ncbi:hypothetical protein [Stenotrophomonas maltophilia]|uniref:hypothetical protein n=1 Tax=Stenotrophomonas maltophilia TaxID=40324 RepID=UPI003C2B222D
MHDEVKLVGALAGVGLIVGIAKMLTSNDPITWKQAVGRAILSGATGLAAGAIVIFIPGVSFVAQVALACILASLGTSALETVLNRVVNK